MQFASLRNFEIVLRKLGCNNFTNFTIPTLYLNPKNLDVGSLTLNMNPTLHTFSL